MHYKDNIYYCFEEFCIALRGIKRKYERGDYSNQNSNEDANQEIKEAVKRFKKNFKKIVGREYKKHSSQEIREIYEEEFEEIKKIWKLEALKKYKENFEREIKDFEETGILYGEIRDLDKIDITFLSRIIEILEQKKSLFKAMRGRKSGGRPPKMFNVFLYYLVNKLTFWKYDKNRRLCKGKNRKPKLEKNWNLIIFMLLWIYFHKFSFKKLEGFISKNENESIEEALYKLRKKVQREYSNFKPRRGEFFNTGKDYLGWTFTRISDEGFYSRLL